MFNMFRKKTEPEAIERKPRGVLPTYATNEIVVLSKASPAIRDTYEIRLALFMAVSRGLRFILAVRPQAVVDPTIKSLLQEHGGKIEEAQLEDFSVYLGHASSNGEMDGWVLGNTAALSTLKDSVQSPWLKARLNVGYAFSGAELDDLNAALGKESITSLNVDGENVGRALLALIAAARNDGGSVFIQ